MGEKCRDSHAEGPSLHHFRSSNHKSEEKYLQECWKKCLHDLGVSLLPAKVLYVENEEGNMEILHSTDNAGSAVVTTVEGGNEPGVAANNQSIEEVTPDEIQAENGPVSECNPPNEEEVAPPEENIVSFQLVPDSNADLPLDGLDENVVELEPVRTAEHNKAGACSNATATVDQNYSVKGIYNTKIIF